MAFYVLLAKYRLWWFNCQRKCCELGRVEATWWWLEGCSDEKAGCRYSPIPFLAGRKWKSCKFGSDQSDSHTFLCPNYYHMVHLLLGLILQYFVWLRVAEVSLPETHCGPSCSFNPIIETMVYPVLHLGWGGNDPYYIEQSKCKTLCPKSPSARGLVACLPVHLLFKSTKHNAFYPV